jgi:hypothetical protein
MGGWQATGQFTLDNNVAPSISALTTPSGEQSGNVGVTYTLTDPDTALLSIQAEYTTDGSTWFAANGTPTANIAPGTGIGFTWDSASDLAGYYGTTVQLRLRPVDTDGDMGGWQATLNFTLDNNVAPSISTLTTPAGTQSGDVITSYTLTDPDTALLSIEAEYTTDSLTWFTATGTPKTNVAPGTGIDFTWNSATDLLGYNGSGVKLHLRASDTDFDKSSWVETGGFTLNN